jgi:SAM-dependent methyltransferase
MDWHNRFTQQAKWTAELRNYLFRKTGLDGAKCILEIGCGTGAVIGTLSTLEAKLFGLDINQAFLQQAAVHAPGVTLIQGDAHRLPFASNQFDGVYFHFTLLWLSDPLRALNEAQRLIHPGGWVMALAEPDYGGRIDYPDPLIEIGRLQAESLQRQGADPFLGRRLRALFHQASLTCIETGVISGQWSEPPSLADLDREWEVLETDLQGMLPDQELSKLRQIDLLAWQSGERLLFVPTFYAIGQAQL